jgi:phage terminase large subunit GpA-like protein
VAVVNVAPALTEAVPDWWLALTPPPALTISEWADAYRRLRAEDSAEPGGWRTSRTEYRRGIMDAGGDPRVREVIIVKAAQLGGTQLLLNPVCKISQTGLRPRADVVSASRIRGMPIETSAFGCVND